MAKSRGTRKCEVCERMLPTMQFKPYKHGKRRRTCDKCFNVPKVNAHKCIPAEWTTPLQVETDPLRYAIQCLGPSTCFKCKHSQTCRENVADYDYRLPCQVSL